MKNAFSICVKLYDCDINSWRVIQIKKSQQGNKLFSHPIPSSALPARYPSLDPVIEYLYTIQNIGHFANLVYNFPRFPQIRSAQTTFRME